MWEKICQKKDFHHFRFYLIGETYFDNFSAKFYLMTTVLGRHLSDTTLKTFGLLALDGLRFKVMGFKIFTFCYPS